MDPLDPFKLTFSAKVGFERLEQIVEHSIKSMPRYKLSCKYS